MLQVWHCVRLIPFPPIREPRPLGHGYSGGTKYIQAVHGGGARLNGILCEHDLFPVVTKDYIWVNQ